MGVSMEKSEKSEKVPLLVENATIERVQLLYPKWLAYSVIIIIPMSHLCSYVLSLFVLNQYTYYAFMKEKYPNATDKTETLPTCTVNTSSAEYKHQIEVQKTAAQWSMYCNLAFLIPSLFMNMNLATYSDVYGRKLFFIIPLVGSVLKTVLSSLGIYFEINVRLLLISYMIEASTGSWIATLSMSVCFIADTTQPGKPRSFLIGLLEGGLGIGGFIATLISGFLITWTDGFFYPEIIATCFVAIGLLLALTMVQETLHQSSKRKHVSIWQNMKRVTECCTPNFSSSGKPWMFIILLFIFAMSAISNLSRANVETLYQLNSPFCWDSVQIGVYSAVRACCWNIGALFIIKLCHICTSDEVIALVGCMTTVTSLVIEGLANSELMLYISAASSIGSTVTMPMVRGIMSRMTPTQKQGSVFAGIAAVEGVSALVGAVTMNALYNITVDIYRGMAFLIWSVFGCTGIVLCIILITGTRKYSGGTSDKNTSIIVEYSANHKETKN